MSAYLNIPLGFGPMEAIGPISFFLSSSAQLQPILLIPAQNSSPESLSKAPKSRLATPVGYLYPILCYPNYHNVWRWSGTSLILASSCRGPPLRHFTVICWKIVVINVHSIINYNLNCAPRTVQCTSEQRPWALLLWCNLVWTRTASASFTRGLLLFKSQWNEWMNDFWLKPASPMPWAG